MMAMMMPVVVVTSRYCIREEEAKLKVSIVEIRPTYQRINCTAMFGCSSDPLVVRWCGSQTRAGFQREEKKRRKNACHQYRTLLVGY